MKHAFYFLVLIISLQFHARGQVSWLENLKPLVVEDTSERISLRQSMLDNHVNSFSLGVIQEDGDESYFAYSMQKSLERIDANTKYQAGSISKPVAALGVMVLVKNYDLDIDASVNSYLKSWQIASENFDAEKVTIRNLLSHTGGLTVHGFMGYKKEKNVPEVTEILNGEGNSDIVTMFNPSDSNWRYSGGGYEVLHLLVEDVAGKDFAVYMQQEVLNPIGMTNSTYDLIAQGACNDCARAYNREGKAYKQDWNLYPESAAAGLWTTSADLLKFLKYIAELYNGGEGIVATNDIKVMFTPIQNNYGLGFFILEKEEDIYIGHSGKNIGFTNDMAINLNTGEGFVCLTDSDAAFPLIEDIKRSMPGEGRWTNRAQVLVSRTPRTEEELNGYLGNYAYKAGKGRVFKAKVVIEGGELVLINRNSGARHVLIPGEGNRFFSSVNGSTIDFQEENGQSVLIIDERIKLLSK